MTGSQLVEVGSISIRATDLAEWCNGRHAMLKPSCLSGVRVRPSPRLLVGQAVPDGGAYVIPLEGRQAQPDLHCFWLIAGKYCGRTGVRLGLISPDCLDRYQSPQLRLRLRES